MSPTLLSRRLKQLEAEGVVERRPAERAGAWTYHLTRSGLDFLPLIETLGIWGQRWARRQLVEGEIDLGLLVWSLERSVDVAAFGKKRAVVRLELTDQPAGKDVWWFLNQDDGCELCLEDPGFDVDLYLATTLPDMIYIARGDLTVSRAKETGRLEVIGSARATRALSRWLNLGPITTVRSERGDAPV